MLPVRADHLLAFKASDLFLVPWWAGMTVEWLIGYAGLALVYAIILTGGAFAVARKLRLAQSWRAAPFVLSTLFFVMLTQHPFPSPSEMDCPIPSATPQLRVLRFMEPVIDLYQAGAGLLGMLSNRTTLATLMNFLICAIIGATLSRHVERLWVASLFGCGLSLGIELTQLTGIWGLYPCAYRQFNVDDLLMNVLGVSLGFWVWRRLRGKTHAGRRVSSEM